MKTLNLVLAAILISVSVFSQELNQAAEKLAQENKKAFQSIIEVVESTNEGNLNFEDVNEQVSAREKVSRFKHITNKELFEVIALNSLTPQQFETKFEAMQAPTNWVNVKEDLFLTEINRKIARMDKNDKMQFSGKKANQTADILTGAGFGTMVVGAVVLAPPVAVIGGLVMTTGWITGRVAAHKTSRAVMDLME